MAIENENISTPSLTSTKSRRRKAKGFSSTSTPLTNWSIEKNKIDSHNSFFCLDEQLLVVFKKILDLEKQWNSILKETGLLFCKLATQLTKATKSLDKNEDLDSTNNEILKMFFEDSGVNQNESFIQGCLIETSYDKLFKELQSMDECVQQVSASYSKILSLHKLSETSLGSNSYSSLNVDNYTSKQMMMVSSTISELILWPALLTEFNKLIGRLEKDLAIRHYLISIIYSSKSNKLHLTRLWNDLGLIVRWFTFTDMIQHLVKLI